MIFSLHKWMTMIKSKMYKLNNPYINYRTDCLQNKTQVLLSAIQVSFNTNWDNQINYKWFSFEKDCSHSPLRYGVIFLKAVSNNN